MIKTKEVSVTSGNRMTAIAATALAIESFSPNGRQILESFCVRRVCVRSKILQSNTYENGHGDEHRNTGYTPLTPQFNVTLINVFLGAVCAAVYAFASLFVN